MSASSDEVVLKQPGKDEELRLEVDPSTQVLIDGKQASVDQIREGTQVRASFDPSSQKATRIEAGGAPGQTGSPGGDAAKPAGATGPAPRGGGY